MANGKRQKRRIVHADKTFVIRHILVRIQGWTRSDPIRADGFHHQENTFIEIISAKYQVKNDQIDQDELLFYYNPFGSVSDNNTSNPQGFSASVLI